MNAKISVIIPAYNSEQTIERCISSVQRQSYQNLEIIVINDGSIDETEQLVTELIKRDNRIILLNISNGGVSHARNIGIEKATGNYLAFLDADDYFYPEMLATLLKEAKENDVKIAHCSYFNVDNNKKIISVVGNHGKKVIQSHDEAIECLISGRLFSGGLCNKLYDIDLFKYVRLDESIKYAEDILANFMLFDQVKKSVYIDKPLYCYVSSPGSSTHSADPVMYQEQGLFISEEIQKKSIGKSYEKTATSGVAIATLRLYKVYICNGNNKQNKLKEKVIEYKKDGYYDTKEKMVLLGCRYLPRLLPMLFCIYDKVRIKNLDPTQLSL